MRLNNGALLVTVAALVLQVVAAEQARIVDDANAYSDVQYQGMFLSWTQEHGKQYQSSEIFGQRYNAFKANDVKITKHNAANETWYMEHNLFSDLTSEEFLNQYTGLDSSMADEGGTIETGIGDIDASINWRRKGAVTGVKFQGGCNSCWSFAATGAIESAVKIAGGKLTSLSEQNLLDCANGNCNGGVIGFAFRYAMANGGICKESAYPYPLPSKMRTCRNNCRKFGNISNFDHMNTESALLAGLLKGPVAVAIDPSALQHYGGGVITDCGGRTLKHAVLVVGYNGKDYQLKNQWGTKWGESGYFRMPHGKNCCGLAKLAVRPYL